MYSAMKCTVQNIVCITTYSVQYNKKYIYSNKKCALHQFLFYQWGEGELPPPVRLSAH